MLLSEDLTKLQIFCHRCSAVMFGKRFLQDRRGLMLNLPLAGKASLRWIDLITWLAA